MTKEIFKQIVLEEEKLSRKSKLKTLFDDYFFVSEDVLKNQNTNLQT